MNKLTSFFVIAIFAMLYSFSARADMPVGKNALLVNFGVTGGGPALGLDFEHGYDSTFGVGGYFRMDPDDKDNGVPGLTAIGGFIRPHFNRQQWDFYVSPGFGFIFWKQGNRSTQSLLGPTLALGLLYEFSTAVSVGIETMQYASWTGSGTDRGLKQTDLMAKFRFIF